MKLEQGTFSIFPSNIAQDLEAYEQVVLAWLWKHKNEAGTCFPSLTRLCELCHLSKPTIIKALTSLEERGIISKDKQLSEDGGYARNIYTVYIQPVKTWVPPSKEDSLGGGKPGSPTLVSTVDTNYTNRTIPVSEQPKAGFKECKRLIGLWSEFTKGRPPVGRLLRSLGPLVRDLGEQEVYDRLLAFTKSQKPLYASIERFASVHGQFEARRPTVEFFNPHEKIEGE